MQSRRPVTVFALLLDPLDPQDILAWGTSKFYNNGIACSLTTLQILLGPGQETSPQDIWAVV